MEARDPAIKLFGKEIALPENGRIPAVSGGDCVVEGGWSNNDLSSVMGACLEGKKVSRIGDEEQGDEEEEKEVEAADKENIDPETLPELEENPKTPSIEEEAGSSKPPECESNDQTDASNSSQQKALKKPDKILHCPRCSSMDTKFCYFNNYNVNQPRHFCKSCQRYWTAGGTMRNVPVGAGRRKNKNSSASHLHCRQNAISEALQAARMDPPNGIHNLTFKSGGTVLNFGPEGPLCESVASVLNVAENMASPSGVCNGFCKGGNRNNCYSGSPVTSSNFMEEGMRNGVQDPMIGELNGFTSQMSEIPCLPGISWPYPWSSAVPVPAFCPPGYPIPFYTAPYWNCGVPSGWSVPWLSPPAPATNQKPSSAPNSPLGKHSRNGDLIKPSSPEGKEEVAKQNNSERSVLVPKTLRIDDPDEAAKSSIWATLGIKNDSVGLFKAAFQPKSVEKNRKCETHPALRANPAAMSRSLSFQEGV